MNRRLTAIADMVKPQSILADIGSDHAHLCIFLIQTNRIVKAYACDIAQGPLQAAFMEISRAHLQGRIFPILSDGFAHVPSDVDSAVIAGMGFRTAIHILEAAKERLSALRQIIVQVNDDPVSMRKWLSDHHFMIMDERYVSDRGKDYILMAFHGSKAIGYTYAECVLGPLLMKKNDPEYRAYCGRRKSRIEHILQMRRDEKEDTKSLKQELNILTSFLQ